MLARAGVVSDEFLEKYASNRILKDRQHLTKFSEGRNSSGHA